VAQTACLRLRAIMLIWAVLPSYLIAAFCGKRLSSMWEVGSSCVGIVGSILPLVWAYVWRGDFLGTAQDGAMVSGVFLFSSSLECELFLSFYLFAVTVFCSICVCQKNRLVICLMKMIIVSKSRLMAVECKDETGCSQYWKYVATLEIHECSKRDTFVV
jgi:hypothetical protein